MRAVWFLRLDGNHNATVSLGGDERAICQLVRLGYNRHEVMRLARRI